MKKQICLLLALCLLLCGCGSAGEAVSGQITPAQTEASAQEERTVSLGRIEGGEYRNEYVGYGCTLDSSWVFYSAEELQEIPDNVSELLEGTEVGDSMDQFPQISDMAAENAEELLTMNVLYTKISMQERLAYAVLTEQQILEQVLLQKDTLITSYAQAGIEVSEMEMVQVTFLGQERWAIHTTSTIQGIPYYILQLYDYHLGQYGVVTTLSSYMEDNTASLLELFYAID